MMRKLSEIFEDHKGPPVVIEGIIRELGVLLDKKTVLDPEISGQIERVDDTFKISANKSDHYYRQRFTMAHELGHYLYHSDLIGEGVDDNRAFRSTPEGRFYNTKIGSREETQANRFAASILMPKSLVVPMWSQVQDIESMAKEFQVSHTAMKIRLKSLGFDTD